MRTLHGNRALRRRDALPRICGSQLGMGSPAESIHSTEDGGQAEYFVDYGCHHRIVEYTPEDRTRINKKPLPAHIL